MNPLAAGAPAASVFAGVSVAAVSLAGMLLPGLQQGVTAPDDVPCAKASMGSPAKPLPTPTSSGAAYELCLSVTPGPSAQAKPGDTVTYRIQVWLASLTAAGTTAASPPGIPATVSLQVSPGSGTLKWSSCPGTASALACALPPMQPGPPPTSAPLQAELTVPASPAGQQIGFTVRAADPDGGTNVLPAVSNETVTVASPSPSPSASSPSPSPSPSTATPSPSPSTTKPSPSPTRSRTHSPSPSPSPSHSSPSSPKPAGGGGTGGSGGKNPGTVTPVSPIGASLPAGFTYSPAPRPAASLGKLPAPLPGASVPAASFPKVSPEPSVVPAPVTLPGPRIARVADVSAEFPLDSRLIGIQVGGLAVLAAAVTIAVARLSLRRRSPRHGK